MIMHELIITIKILRWFWHLPPAVDAGTQRIKIRDHSTMLWL